jgi:RNA polymerase sigma-70 factor (ECF subfamily)
LRLVDSLFVPVWQFLVNFMDVPEPDAEEIAQDTFLKVHSSVRGYHNDGRAKLTTWIFEIARNRAIDFHRVCRPEQEELADDLQIPADGEVAGRNKSYLAWLRVELPKLSSQDRNILLWRAKDFSYAEIGSWLGIKEGTARVRHHRALEKLGVAAQTMESNSLAITQEISKLGAEHE